MARSHNTSRNRNDWTADRQSRRAIDGKATKSSRKHERRDIERTMRGDDYNGRYR